MFESLKGIDEEQQAKMQKELELRTKFFERWGAGVGSAVVCRFDNWGEPLPEEVGTIERIVSLDHVFAEWTPKCRGTWHMQNLLPAFEGARDNEIYKWPHEPEPAEKRSDMKRPGEYGYEAESEEESIPTERSGSSETVEIKIQK